MPAVWRAAAALIVVLCLLCWTPWQGPTLWRVAGPCGLLQLDMAFRSGMVLQHTKPCVAGTAPALVRLSDGNATVEADQTHCRFVICLPARSPSSVPTTLTLQSQGARIVLEDVLFGDVFLCLGQSNMLMSLTHQSHHPNASYPYQATLQGELALVRPAIRVLDPNSSEWKTPSVSALKHFSAVCWFFGFRLYQALNPPNRSSLRVVVPLGLLTDGWPGVPIVAFLEPRRVSVCGNSSCLALLPRTCGWMRSIMGQRRLQGLLEGPQHPAYAYTRGVIRLLRGVPVRGVLFYQGESDIASSSAYACRQRVLLEQLRVTFGAATPFIFTVIA
eukprot:EG_transcript_19308